MLVVAAAVVVAVAAVVVVKVDEGGQACQDGGVSCHDCWKLVVNLAWGDQVVLALVLVCHDDPSDSCYCSAVAVAA